MNNHKEIVSGVETLTSQQCAKLLEKNVHNRGMRDAVVCRYATDMKEKRWTLTGEPVIIAANGDLMNGQHRLAACVKAGIPLITLVIRGVDRNTFAEIDTGVPRTAGDVLTIGGLDPGLAKTCAAAARKAIMLEQNGSLTRGKVTQSLLTPARIDEWVTANPRIVVVAKQIHAMYRTNSPLVRSEATFLAFFMLRIDADSTLDFFDGVFSGADLAETDPRLVFRARVQAQRGSTVKWTLTAKMQAAIRAWHWFVRGKEVRQPGNMFHGLPQAFDLIAPPRGG